MDKLMEGMKIEADEIMRAERKVLRQEPQSFQTEMESVIASRIIPNLEDAESKAEEQAFEVESVDLCFDSLSCPGLTTVLLGEAASVTVAYSYPHIAHNYAISSIPLHRSRPSKWQVEVVHLRGGIVLGIIGKLQPTTYPSRNDVSCFGWHSGKNVIVAGSDQRDRDSWPGWKAGNRGIFTYSPLRPPCLCGF
mmetsp:Transcript_14465/g.21578  ORF Transcript_14465/g.21578 Transcript_14465/m.21578 type:complete len:193 (+) Transcript_14465:319-897(+)